MNWKSLIAPQFVGFAGLALLGRPGELVRPYLIAMKTNESFHSQMALWFIERAADTAAVALILAIDLFAIPKVRAEYAELRIFGYLLLGMSTAFVGLLYLLWRNGPAVSAWICQEDSAVLTDRCSYFGTPVAIREPGTARDPRLQVACSRHPLFRSSYGSWSLAYRQTMHAFPMEHGLARLWIATGSPVNGARISAAV